MPNTTPWEDLGITQKKFAEIIGVPSNTLTKAVSLNLNVWRKWLWYWVEYRLRFGTVTPTLSETVNPYLHVKLGLTEKQFVQKLGVRWCDYNKAKRLEGRQVLLQSLLRFLSSWC